MDPYRLPQSIVPHSYSLCLVPDLEQGSFWGTVKIQVTFREPVKEVWLNAAELIIEDAGYALSDLEDKAQITLDEKTERVCLRFDTFRQPGFGGHLVLTFRGTLNDRLRGFYRSKYRDDADMWHWLAATQFEATDARRAFPCFDEPAFKAVFETTLLIPEKYVAISNTAIQAEVVNAGQRQITFAPTIPMSTYLVAFVIGPLVGTDPVMVGKTPVRVWSVPGKEHLTRFGGLVAVESLRFFEQYYARPYPGDKLDLVAIPDFAAGAMENLGCITFRETALLIDEAQATHQEKERIADVVAHENAHMWFGDLVTMRWWNGLWLNEAFATFMEMLAVDAFRPQWQRWVTFGVSRSSAFAVDGLNSTRPIEFPVAAPHDAEAMFDVLTYDKGASVLRMLEQYLGEEVFRNGVRLYLDRHAFANTETEDLWKALEEVSHLPIPEIMNGWVFRPGYPLVEVGREGQELVLRQRRFSYISTATTEQERWQIPIQIRIEGKENTSNLRLLLTETEQRVELPPDVQLVLVNEGGHGFYRVRYTAELMNSLLDRLPTLGAIERFNLINDAWASVTAGLMTLTDYLELTGRFEKERDRNVWSVILASFQTLNRVVKDEGRSNLQRFFRSRLSPLVGELGLHSEPGEDELQGQLRVDLLRAIGTIGEDEAIQAEAEKMFESDRIEPAIQSAVVAILAHTGGAARYEQFLERFRSARTPQEENRYLLSLTGFREEPLIARTLNSVLDETIRTQDAPFLLRAMLLSPHGRKQAWSYFQKHWVEMSTRFPGPGIRRVCEGVLGLVSREWEQEVRQFFQAQHVQLGGKTLDQFLEQLHITVELQTRESAALNEFLAGR